jgi:hypothetical protein
MILYLMLLINLFAKNFSKIMQGEFGTSMVEELNSILGLQHKLKMASSSNQAKYIKELLKKIKMEDIKSKSTQMSTSIKLDKDEGGKCMLFNSCIFHENLTSH